MANAATRLSATYDIPFQMHASIGPSCGVADVQGDHATVYSGTQDSYGMRNNLAKLLNLPAENIHVVNVEASGAYGRNGADDATTDALEASYAADQVVKVETREGFAVGKSKWLAQMEWLA